ncbi:MAG: hypothetical protein AAGL89_09700, partial [Pseudomonadota bacterium]
MKTKETNSERPKGVDGHFEITETRDPINLVFDAQYRSLRQEILEHQSRRFYLTLGAAFGIPSLSGVNFTDALVGEFLILVPIMVVAVSFLFIQEVSAISRVGKFIEEVIESQFAKEVGWEHYLRALREDQTKIPRTVRATNSAFMWLMLMYFLLGWILANLRVFETLNEGLLAIYNVLMILLLV